MKLTFGVPAGLLFVSTIAMGQYGGSPFPQAANPELRNGGFVTVASAHNEFYNRVLESQVDQYRADNRAIGQAPTALAGNNMRTDGQQLAKDTFSQSSGNDFYNGVLAAQVDEYIAGKNGIAPQSNALAGNNMITDRQQLAKDSFSQSSGNDFYNGVLAAQVDEYIAGKNGIAPQSTLLAGKNMITGEQPQLAPVPEDFYNRVLAAKVDEYIVDNNAVAPSAIRFAELQPMSEVPGSIAASMASDAGAQGERDWYDRVVATQAELNRRIKKSEVPSTF